MHLMSGMRCFYIDLLEKTCLFWKCIFFMPCHVSRFTNINRILSLSSMYVHHMQSERFMLPYVTMETSHAVIFLLYEGVCEECKIRWVSVWLSSSHTYSSNKKKKKKSIFQQNNNLEKNASKQRNKQLHQSHPHSSHTRLYQELLHLFFVLKSPRSNPHQDKASSSDSYSNFICIVLVCDYWLISWSTDGLN